MRVRGPQGPYSPMGDQKLGISRQMRCPENLCYAMRHSGQLPPDHVWPGRLGGGSAAGGRVDRGCTEAVGPIRNGGTWQAAANTGRLRL